MDEEHNIRCNIKLRTRQQTLPKTSFLFVCFIFVLLINQPFAADQVFNVFLLSFKLRNECVLLFRFIIAYNYNSTINIIHNSDSEFSLFLSLSLSLSSYT